MIRWLVDVRRDNLASRALRTSRIVSSVLRKDFLFPREGYSFVQVQQNRSCLQSNFTKCDNGGSFMIHKAIPISWYIISARTLHRIFEVLPSPQCCQDVPSPLRNHHVKCTFCSNFRTYTFSQKSTDIVFRISLAADTSSTPNFSRYFSKTSLEYFIQLIERKYPKASMPKNGGDNWIKQHRSKLGL